MMIIERTEDNSLFRAFFVTHEYLWTKEHNDLILSYLIENTGG
jgi:hypothetical protein